jgi:hypothetical protein
MRRLKFICFCLALSSWLGGLAYAQGGYMPFEFNGQKVLARPVAFKDTHIQLAIQGGGLTNVPWGHLSQGSLQNLIRLRNVPAYAPYSAFATPFLDPPPQSAPQGQRVSVKEVKRPPRPASGGLTASPVMYLVFFLLYLANLYAAYEVGVYRQRNSALVCGLAAVVPVVTPLIFLCLPSTIEPPAEEEAPTEEAASEGVTTEAADGEAAAAPAEAAAAAAAPEQQVTVYQRGQFTFNRRFFETKLAGFLKMVPGEAEKDMVLVVSSSRGVYTGTRLTRVSPNELTLHVVKGGASQDVMIPFGEISELKVQHKDTV